MEHPVWLPKYDIVHILDQAFSKRVWLFTKKRPLNKFSAVLANENTTLKQVLFW